MGTPHTSCKRGTTVLMTLKAGTKFVDKFREKKGNFVILLQHGRIRISDIRAMSIYKGVNYSNSECILSNKEKSQ